jgi:L-amino acid N-acyltransferase YncA
MNNVLIGGDGWVYYETVAGGAGGRPGRPGSPGGSGVHTGMTNTLNTPVEALERSFPIRVLHYSLRRRSGGAGLSPGGEGIERDLLMLEDVTVSLITERRASRPWGLAGGLPGAAGENWLVPAGDEARARRLPDKCTVRLSAGDVLRMLTPGGGGWGPPPAVRPMEPGDIEAVQAVENAAGELFRPFPDPRIAACADHDPMPAAVLAEFVDAGRAWVSVVVGEVVGFVVAEVSDGGAHVEELAVAPAWNGSGIGGSLLEAVADWADAEGLASLTLTTFRDVPFNRPWYERRGFRVVPDGEQTASMRTRVRHEDEAYGLPAELRVVMQRDLVPPVSVRDAVEGDLPAITDLYNALIPTTTIAWRDHLASDEEMSGWFAGQQVADHPVLVAEIDGRVVGYTTWTGFRYSERFPGYRHSMELTIHVDRSVHGRGIGRTLIEALVERARTAGVHVLVAGADADNTASIAFHSALGFEEVARMPEVGRKFDRWLDLVLLQRVID